ncbi:MAG: NAD(P)-binding protein [Acidimicrobiia bacterium]|nr:NAD(P)-binding protein [Acidimicrobiia bacterium]
MVSSVLIVGAGMAGITAGRFLGEAGMEVTLLDKGRAVGGRMATRRLDGGAGDHGAQHASTRSPEFAAEMARLVTSGVASEWLRTPSRSHPERGVEPRYAGVGGMRRIPEALAEGLRVQTAVRVDRLDFVDGRVHAIDADGAVVGAADAVVVTPPVPQLLDLLAASGLERPPDLEAIEYHASLAVIALLDAPAGIPGGHLAPDDPVVGWIADNAHKGTSARPSVTIHSTPQFAARHIDGDREDWTRLLIAAADRLHSGVPVATHSHAWRYAEPTATLDEGARLIEAPGPVVLAGEVFSGARVEGAYLSGRAAAARILEGR